MTRKICIALFPRTIKENDIEEAEQVLLDYGISPEWVDEALRDVGKKLLGVDLYLLPLFLQGAAGRRRSAGDGRALNGAYHNYRTGDLAARRDLPRPFLRKVGIYGKGQI